MASRKLQSALENAGLTVEVTRSFGSFWEAVVQDGTRELRVQLALDSPFRLRELVEMDGLQTHSLEDLAAGKLLALFSRAEARDFIDLYFIVKTGRLSMEQVIEMARKKDPGLDDYFLAIAFRQAESLPDDPSRLRVTMTVPVDLAALKSYFAEQSVALLARRLP